MTYYEKKLAWEIKADNDIVIDGVTFPETTEPIQCVPQLMSDGGRLADSIDYEGSILGVKHTITLTYGWLNKHWFDIIYNATMGKYESNPSSSMFFDVTVPTYTSLGVKTFKCYLGASSLNNAKCIESTEDQVREKGQQYSRYGNLYDELHTDIEIILIEK